MATPVLRPPAASQRWLARLSLASAVAAALVLVAVAGWHSVVLVLVIAAHVVVIVMGLWLALAHRGAVRLLGVTVIVAAQVTAWALEIRAGLLWAVTVVWVLLALAVVSGV